jgi:hypothetical protein
MIDMGQAELGVTATQLASMQKSVNKLERENDAIADTPIRQKINSNLIEIRLLLRDGHLQGMNGGRKKPPCQHPNLCPWKVQPVVGMYARVEGIDFWGTDCVLYLKCPDPRWNGADTKEVPDE